MPLLAAEAAKLTQDQLRAGVIETIIEESPMLRRLGFQHVEGNSFAYNQEATLGGASFFAVNATWTEAAMAFTKKTAALAILGGDADVDNFLWRTRSRETDQMAVQVAGKAKDVARKWEQTMITGDVAGDANSFDGIRKLTVAGQTINTGANGGPLTLALLDELIDKVLGGKPACC